MCIAATITENTELRNPYRQGGEDLLVMIIRRSSPLWSASQTYCLGHAMYATDQLKSSTSYSAIHFSRPIMYLIVEELMRQLEPRVQVVAVGEIGTASPDRTLPYRLLRMPLFADQTGDRRNVNRMTGLLNINPERFQPDGDGRAALTVPQLHRPGPAPLSQDRREHLVLDHRPIFTPKIVQDARPPSRIHAGQAQ